ncbi:hypothetical protein Scep_009883 [Stephania cephalantha]|uniref:Uncharacterized protein n=1 Tax=Stephania cephalantha TaxID=152367 RepID=A0AAP0JU23_9MAGN
MFLMWLKFRAARISRKQVSLMRKKSKINKIYIYMVHMDKVEFIHIAHKNKRENSDELERKKNREGEEEEEEEERGAGEKEKERAEQGE